MEKIFYKVQITKKENCGHRTYTEQVEDVQLFDKENLKKAVSLWKKRAANTIWRHQVEYLDHAPYYMDCFIKGEVEYDENCNKYLVFRDGSTKKIVEFYELQVR